LEWYEGAGDHNDWDPNPNSHCCELGILPLSYPVIPKIVQSLFLTQTSAPIRLSIFVADGQLLQIQVIDTAAWNEFPAMQSLFIKMAHLVVVVYDVNPPNWRESLETVIQGVRLIKGRLKCL